MTTPIKIDKSIIVKGNIREIYGMWTDFEHFPLFMKHIKSVRATGESTNHWKVTTLFGGEVEWNAQITQMEENKRVAWKTISGDIQTSGQVTFNELNNTEVQVTVQMQYVPPAGPAGRLASLLMVQPEQEVDESLKEFKKFIEKNTQIAA